MSDLSGSCPALTFKLDKDRILTTPDTTFIGDPCSKIKKNTKVTVRGVRQADGSIRASRIQQKGHTGDGGDGGDQGQP